MIFSIKLKQEFVALDLDGNGEISVKELFKLLKSIRSKLRMTKEEIAKLVRDTDQDGDGNVSVEEFLKMIEIENIRGRSNKRDMIHKALIQRASVRKAFEKYDKDGSGTISRDEFQTILENRYMSSLSSEQVDELMNKADKDRSGQIDYEEFLNAFSYLTASAAVQSRLIA